jgi:hypothetical protein
MAGQSSGQGRYNDRAGRAWEKACAEWLRETGLYPHAEQNPRGTVSDLSGTGDVAAECTVKVWEEMWRKLVQAEKAADARGLPWPAVWKRATGGRPGEGFVIMRALDFWHMAKRLDGYEAREMDGAAEYRRGYRDGAAGRAVEEARA